MWKVPIMVGQVVKLNPDRGSFAVYERRQSKGTAGVIVRVNMRRRSLEDVIINPTDAEEIRVHWGCGNYNTHQSSDLIPIENTYIRIVETDDTYYTTKNNRAILESHWMNSGRSNEPNVFDTKYRKMILNEAIQRLAGLHGTEKDVAYLADVANTEEGELDVEEFFKFGDTGHNFELHLGLHKFPVAFTTAEQVEQEAVEVAPKKKARYTYAHPTETAPPASSRKTTESFDEYIARVTEAGIEITEDDMNVALLMPTHAVRVNPASEILEDAVTTTGNNTIVQTLQAFSDGITRTSPVTRVTTPEFAPFPWETQMFPSGNVDDHAVGNEPSSQRDADDAPLLDTFIDDEDGNPDENNF